MAEQPEEGATPAKATSKSRSAGKRATKATAKATTKATAKATPTEKAAAKTVKAATKAAAKSTAKATTKAPAKRAAAAKAAPKLDQESGSGSSVRASQVVPTCNRSERMMRLLGALAAQDMDEPFEVVVVDDVSKDDTLSRLPAAAPTTCRSNCFSGLRIFGQHLSNGRSELRRRKARGERVAFVDDDCVPDPGWLKAITGGLEDADVTVGRTRPPEDQMHLIGPFSSYLDLEHNRSFSTCNIAYRRAVLEQTDGFDEVNFRFPNGEDTDLGLRAVNAGWRDHYVPDAIIWHDVGPSTFAAHWHRIPRLDGLVALVKLHPEAREIMQCGYFLRSVDKAVFIGWAALLSLLLRPRWASTRLFAAIAAVLYVWQYRKWHYKARSTTELLTSIPRGFVADSWATMVMIRSSARYRTLLL